MIHYVHQPNIIPGGYEAIQMSVCGKSLKNRQEWKSRVFGVECADCLRIIKEKKEEFNKINNVCGICGKELTALEKALVNPKDLIRTCAEHKKYASTFNIQQTRQELGYK